MKQIKTILGIDPGYDRIGWAIGGVDSRSKWSYIKFGCIQTKKNNSLIKRYQTIDHELSQIVNQYKPQEAAIESLFFFKNKKTAMKVSEARGVIISAIMRQKVQIFEYTPLVIKQTVTGYGRSNKKAVEKMVRLEFGKMKEKIIDDAIDALAIIHTHAIINKNKKYYA